MGITPYGLLMIDSVWKILAIDIVLLGIFFY